MEYDAILGTDELDRNNMIIDYKNGHVQIGAEIITFEKNNLNGIENEINEGDNLVKNIMNVQKFEIMEDIVCDL